ncbi:hypothetical protein PHLGIDRAFT_243798 [Phlebiopsis gigantea 11061_1 CR5-6]|uniref:Uncharacterized protein n=1 Tax=Phlebiopsis gigantea (strain 11061_1 CR5-6) TaxID=745531 RepID=A0A0C3S1U9_PHLG1|nr:hypothetical protein PHLGIDRAFT_243798 [Phlebiopsis gigantea 11061_1 CR5-6]
MADTSRRPNRGQCREYVSTGKCKFGDKCRYVHAVPIIRPFTGDQAFATPRWAQNTTRPNTHAVGATPRNSTGERSGVKDNTCQDCQQEPCRSGPGCRSSRGTPAEPFRGDALNENGTWAPPKGEQLKKPYNPSKKPTNATRVAPTKPCFKWVAAGRCFKGDGCPYYHDPIIPTQLEEQRLQREAEQSARQAEINGQQAEERTRRQEQTRRDAEASRKKQEEERARHEAEARRREEHMRREAEAHRRREEDRIRREAEALQRREEDRARHEAERVRRQRELALVDAARKFTREVDNCLVTFGAGLEVSSVVASFDVVRGRIPDLPERIQAKNLVNFFASHGIDDSAYVLNKAYRNNSAFVIIAANSVARLDTFPSLDGENLRFVPFMTGLGDDAQTTGSTFSRTLNFQTLLQSFAPAETSDLLLANLETKARSFGLESIYKETSPGPRGCNKVRFNIVLDSWEHARDLRDHLRLQRSLVIGYTSVPFNNLFLPSKYAYPIFMPRVQYDSQKTQWDELTQSCREDSCELKVRDFPGKVRINIFGDDISHVGPLKVRAEQLARGTTINMWNRRLFANDVAEKLTQDLRAATGALVQVDRRFRCLRAYGSAIAIEDARQRLELYAEELARKEYTRELVSQKTIRFFADSGFQQLTETYGEEAVTMDLNSFPKKITVTGDEEIRHRLDQLFDDSLKDWVSTNTGAGGAGQDCPICMCDVTAPTELTCGHIYCTQCLTHFVKSGLESTSFPLTCSGDDARCGAPIAISQLEKFLHEPKFQQLLETAFHAYMEQHPDVLAPCKTPGCTQLFAKDASGSARGSKVVKCPSCFVSACAACGKNPHQGMSCEMAGRDLSEEYINNGRDIRRCPHCDTPIFKDGGCNHVSCKCGRHICWRCMSVFLSSGDCYTHMRERHGGIFEEEMVPEPPRAFPRAPAAPTPPVNMYIPQEFIEEDARARALQRALDQNAARRREEEARRMVNNRLWGQAAADMRRRLDEVEARRRAEQAAGAWRAEQAAAGRHAEQAAGAWRAEQAEAGRRAEQAAAGRRVEQAAAARARQERGGGWCVVM